MSHVVATIEARMGSSRLPGKVLLEAAGKPLLALMVERVRRSRYIDEVVVATTSGAREQPIVDLCRSLGIAFCRGSEDDVLGRVVDAGRAHQAEAMVLMSGDCPLIDPYVLDQHVAAFLGARPRIDLVTNAEVRSFPHGLDCQVMAFTTLAESEVITRPLGSTSPFREHVGWYVRRHPESYPRLDIVAPPALSNPFFRITLDTPADYERIKEIFETLYPTNRQFSTHDVLELGRQRGWIDG